MSTELRDATVTDFGNQWTIYKKNESYYGSSDCLRDIFGDICSTEAVKDKKVIDIGSGTGRIVRMLLDCQAKHVVAIEPSKAMDVLKENLAEFASRVTPIQVTGEKIPNDLSADMVVSIGVLHHIPEPGPVIKAAFNALKPGGKMLIWLYAKEGNELYLLTFGTLRKITTKLSDKTLLRISAMLNYALDIYLFFCKYLPLPMREYFLNHIAKLNREQRELTIFDQLNPAYAKYYTKPEALNLLKLNGFKNLRIFHRHGYSWTVYGEKD